MSVLSSVTHYALLIFTNYLFLSVILRQLSNDYAQSLISHAFIWFEIVFLLVNLYHFVMDLCGYFGFTNSIYLALKVYSWISISQVNLFTGK